MSHVIKEIVIDYCEGPTYNKSLYRGKSFKTYRDVDRVINQLAPRDPEMLGYYKCGVIIVFDNDVTYEARIDLTQTHRTQHAIVLPHVISHCEAMSGRVIPVAYRDGTDRWVKFLEEMEKSNRDMRTKYVMFLDEYFTCDMPDESSTTSVFSNPNTHQRILMYVQHRQNCDWLEVQWYKGPCSCGLFDLLEEIRQEIGGVLPPELSDPQRSLVPPG